MLDRIKEILTMRIGPGKDPVKVQNRRQLAAAALLFAVSRADHVQDAREETVMRNALQECFGMDNSDLEELLAVAATEAASASSDYPFTQSVNDEFSDEEKSDLVRDMWPVAYADGNLHKYEEHLIRKIAVLIYVPHSEFIRRKLEVAEARGGAT